MTKEAETYEGTVPTFMPHSLKQQKKSDTPFTPDRQQIFLDTLEEVGDVKLAANAAGITARTAYNCGQRHPEFHRLMEEAYREFQSRLETLATQRSKISDRIFELQLKRHIPEYSEKIRIEKTTTHLMFNGNMFSLKKMTQEQLAALAVVLGDKAPEEALEAQQTLMGGSAGGIDVKSLDHDQRAALRLLLNQPE